MFFSRILVLWLYGVSVENLFVLVVLFWLVYGGFEEDLEKFVLGDVLVMDDFGNSVVVEVRLILFEEK